MGLPFTSMEYYFRDQAEKYGREWHSDRFHELATLLTTNTNLPLGLVYPFDLHDLRWLLAHMSEYTFSDTTRLQELAEFEIDFYEADSAQYRYAKEERYDHTIGQTIQVAPSRDRRSKVIKLIEFGKPDVDGDVFTREAIAPYLPPDAYYQVAWGFPKEKKVDTFFIGVATNVVLGEDALSMKLMFHGFRGEEIFLDEKKYRFAPYGNAQVRDGVVQKFILRAVGAIPLDPNDKETLEQVQVYHSENEFIREVFFTNVAKQTGRVYERHLHHVRPAPWA